MTDKVTDNDVNRIPITDMLANGFAIYSKTVIQERALPDLRDGLKPVQRRILYSMYDNGQLFTKPTVKSAKVVGNVMGTLHPHGDSLYGALIVLSRPWTMGEPLIDFQGNNGSIDGDAFAAMRYTEARLAQITEDTFMENINKKGVVKFIPNFDDTTTEPTVLPVQFPNILVNGSSGIASGYATSMAPHNLTEVLKVAKLLLLNENATIDDVLNIMPAPDFPTGGTIIGAHNMKRIYNTGKGNIAIRSTYHLEKGATKSKQNIIIDEIPYEVNKAGLVSKLKQIVLSKKVGDLLDVEDESDRSNDVRIRITVKAEADVDAILGYLFKKTDLQHNFNVNNVVIDEGHPRLLGVIPIIKKFNKFRLETLVKGFEADLNAINQRKPIVEGYLKFAGDLDKYLNLIKQSTSRQDAIDKLMGEDFLKVQAENIVSMAVYRLANVAWDKYRDEEDDLNKRATVINKLLSSHRLQVQAVARTYDSLLKKYPRKRKTHVLQEDHQLAVAKVDVIPEEDVVISITSQGYLKRSSLRSYQSTEANLIPLTKDDFLLAPVTLSDPDAELADTTEPADSANPVDDVKTPDAKPASDASNPVEDVKTSEDEPASDPGFKGTTKQYLLLFTSRLRYLYVPIYKIQDAKWKELGQHLSQYGADMKADERIISAYVMTGTKDDDLYNILQVRTNGNVKLTPMSAYVKGSNFFKFSDLVNNEGTTKLLNTWQTVDTNGWVGFKDSSNRVLYYPVDEISVTKSVRATGMKGAGLNKGDTVIASSYEVDEQLLLDKYQYPKHRGRKGFKFKPSYHPTLAEVHADDDNGKAKDDRKASDTDNTK